MTEVVVASPKQNAIRKREYHGMSRTRLYRTWKAMISRCYNPKTKGWIYYGGRGIKVCDRWRNSFAAFASDMSEPSAGLTIERLDSNKDYEPGNCVWATQFTQARNQRSNIWIEHAGIRMLGVDWSKETGVPYRTIRYRIKRGWPMYLALTLCPRPENCVVQAPAAASKKTGNQFLDLC